MVERDIFNIQGIQSGLNNIVLASILHGVFVLMLKLP